VTVSALARYPELFAERAAALPGGTTTLKARQASLEQFLTQGLPTTKNEDYKYTSLSTLLGHAFELAPTPSVVSPALVSSHVLPEFPARAVFVNGHFAPALSSTEFPNGVTVRPLASELDKGQVTLEPRGERRALSALNAAFTQDGAVVRVDAGTVASQPVHLLFLATQTERPTMAHPRNVIVVGVNAKATVLVSHASVMGNGRYLHNGHLDVQVGANASLELFTLQDSGSAALHLEWVGVRQARDSRFRSHLVAVGAQLGRHEVEVTFEGPGAECELSGLFVGRQEQHLDQRTFVNHAVPQCTSKQLYKGVLDDSAHGVFNGRLVVAVEAQKTVALQTNKNLVLAQSAQVDTRPQLEIFADDVKCAHGATVGQLDKDALFYLRSRGIDAEAAAQLLTFAFASEIIDAVPLAPWRTLVHSRLAAQLPGIATEEQR
jgi:Fe-S cluster assembly protein SufD